MALITTTLGEIDESELDKMTGASENDDEIINWVEYWKDGVLVHRSVNLHLKKGLASMLEAASFE